MYRVLCDGQPIYDLRDESLVLLDPQLTLELNSAGSFTFKMPRNHPLYDLPAKMKSCIQVFQDDEEIFNGRIINQKVDFYNQKYCECEGQLAFLNDSIQRPAEYHNISVRGYLETLINNHNSQVEESKQFEVGMVTVQDSNDSLFRYTNYNSTMKEIKEDLIDDLGGYIRVRNYNGHRYIDYIEEYEPNDQTQTIRFGENLLDFGKNTNVLDIATAIIPLGSKKEEGGIEALEERITIAEVNDGTDYLYNTQAVNTYGWITKTVIWDDVKTPSRLKSKAEKWLSDYQWDNVVLEVQAVDLHYTDEEIMAFRIGDKIRVCSDVHGLDRFFPLTKLTINLNNLANNKITLGTTVKTSLSAKANSLDASVQKTVESIPIPSAIVQQAIDEATALITAATHGHVVTTANEQLIMDTDDVETATKVWRWNLNGFGYSNTGYNGPYKTAITMDGWIVGERIAAESISGSKLTMEYKSELQGQYEGYVQTNLKTTKESIEASIRQVDAKFGDYVKTASLDMTLEGITSTVSKKLDADQLGTQIQQNAENVRIAWNQCSQYIQFENGEICIYNNANHNQLVMKINNVANWYYQNGTYIGRIGTSERNGGYKGLSFNLASEGSYMAWAYETSPGSGSYDVKFTYAVNDSFIAKGMHFYDNIYCHNAIQGNSFYTLGDDSKFVFNESPLETLECNNNIVIPSKYNIKRDSDARLKTNIQPTRINALDLLNRIEMKSFDWIEYGVHEKVGIIAQQIQDFLPELVSEDGSDGHLCINENKFLPYILRAIQQLTDIVDPQAYSRIARWRDPYTIKQKRAYIEERVK